MTVLLDRDSRPAVADPLAPVTRAIRAMFGADRLPGLAPGLLVDVPLVDVPLVGVPLGDGTGGDAAEPGWLPASDLVSGHQLPHLLSAAERQWRAAPPAAAALAWKAYTYWMLMPVALGWAAARRVPLPHPADVLVRIAGQGPLVTVGLHPRTTVAVLAGDPLATAGLPRVRVVPDEDALLEVVRGALLDEHLLPMIDSIRREVRVGARTLLGSVASAVAYLLLGAADSLPGDAAAEIGTLLDSLDLADLVELVPGRDGALTVQRRTCCLAFTLPDPKVCAGCCLRTGSS